MLRRRAGIDDQNGLLRCHQTQEQVEEGLSRQYQGMAKEMDDQATIAKLDFQLCFNVLWQIECGKLRLAVLPARLHGLRWERKALMAASHL